tara:strand:- start:24665 stop:28228 length:3564 start_codon:yes stop_codon:yes gene_type:complete
MGCQIKMENGKKTYLTPDGTESKLYNKIAKFTSSSIEADLVFKHAYTKSDVEVNTNGEPIVVNDKFSDGTSLYPRKVLSEYSTLNKLFNKVEGARISEFSKEIEYDADIVKGLKDTFTVSSETSGKVIVTKQGPETVNRKLKEEEDPTYRSVMNRIRTFLQSTGINIQNIDSYLTNVGYRNNGIQGVKGLADTSLRIIALTEGGKTGKTLAEEAGHMGVDFHNNQRMIDKALAKIDQSELYKVHAEHYRSKYKAFKESLTEAEVEAKVRREILGKYVGLAIENNTYPSGFKGVINAIINKLLSFFRPSFKNAAAVIASDIAKGDRGTFQYQPTGDVFFDSANDILVEIKEKLNQYISVLKRTGKKNEANKLVSRLFTMNELSKLGDEGDQQALAFLVEELVNETQAILAQLENRSSLSFKEIDEIDRYFAYYTTYVKELKEVFSDPEMKAKLRKLSHTFDDMQEIHNEFTHKEIIKKITPEIEDPGQIQKILNEFKQISVDSGFLNKWLMSGADSANPIARIMHFMITKLFNRVELATVEYGRDLMNSAEKLGITDTDFLYEKKGKNFTGKFIRPTSQTFSNLTPNQQKFAIIVEDHMNTMYNQIGLQYKGLAPQLSATYLDIVTRTNHKTFKTIKETLVESISLDTLNDEGFHAAIGSRPDGSSERMVPRFYTKKLENPNTITNDALRSLIAFKKMSENYEIMSKESSVFEAMLSVFGKSKLINGKEIKKGFETNDYFKMRNLIDMRVYGESTKELAEIGGKYSASKMLSKFKSYVTANNLAGAFFTQIQGYASAKIFQKLDSYIGEHSSPTAQKFATKMLAKMYPAAMSEIGARNKKAKLTMVLQDLGLFGSTDEIFKDLNKNKIIRTLNDNPSMVGFQLGSYSIKATVAMTAMFHYRLHKNTIVKPGDANYEQGKPIHEYLLNGKRLGLTPDQHKVNMAKFSMIVKRQVGTFEGSLSPTDKAAANRNALVQLLFTHKNWLVTGLSRRMRGDSKNYELGKEEIGYWRAAFKHLSNGWANDMNFLRYYNSKEVFNELPKHHQAAIKRFNIEFKMTVGLFIGMSILEGLFGDDEEGITPYMLYAANKTYLELTTLAFGPSGTYAAIETIKNPMAATGQFGQILEALFNTFNDKEVQSGAYEGYTKRAQAYAKLIPVLKGIKASSDPVSSRRFLKQSQLKYAMYTWDE